MQGEAISPGAGAGRGALSYATFGGAETGSGSNDQRRHRHHHISSNSPTSPAPVPAPTPAPTPAQPQCQHLPPLENSRLHHRSGGSISESSGADLHHQPLWPRWNMPPDAPPDRNDLPRKVAYTLYLNHLLSTWNARMYEFAAVIFTAAAYPKDLTASSIFGILMTLSILLFASLLGTWVDRGKSRLKTLISTISANRISIIAACICWFFIVGLQDLGSHPKNPEAMDSPEDDAKSKPIGFVLGLKNSLFTLVLFLSVLERLSRTANLFSIERDWVPVMAAPESLSNSDEPPPRFGLAELNAVMSRIDLVCKLISPIVLSTFISIVGSVELGILAVLSLNGLTWTAEIWTARAVWKSCDRLRAAKQLHVEGEGSSETDGAADASTEGSNKFISDPSGPWWQRSSRRVYTAFQTTSGGVTTWVKDYAVNIHIYFDHAVWLPSMALSILHFSVLNYSATLSTYLNQSAGFSWNLLTVAKALSAVAEIGSTFFTPWAVRQIGKMWARREKAASDGGVGPIADEDREELLSVREANDQEYGEESFTPQADMGVAVLGFWSLIQMVVSLIPACIALWVLSFTMLPAPTPSNPFPSAPTIISAILLTTIPLSRFGRWTNHLATQQLTQTLVPAEHRSAFAGAEMGFVSLFAMGHWVITAIWSRHAQFRWLALGSVASVACSVAIYAVWLRAVGKARERGRRVSRDVGQRAASPPPGI